MFIGYLIHAELQVDPELLLGQAADDFTAGTAASGKRRKLRGKNFGWFFFHGFYGISTVYPQNPRLVHFPEIDFRVPFGPKMHQEYLNCAVLEASKAFLHTSHGVVDVTKGPSR